MSLELLLRLPRLLLLLLLLEALELASNNEVDTAAAGDCCNNNCLLDVVEVDDDDEDLDDADDLLLDEDDCNLLILPNRCLRCRSKYNHKKPAPTVSTANPTPDHLIRFTLDLVSTPLL